MAVCEHVCYCISNLLTQVVLLWIYSGDGAVREPQRITGLEQRENGEVVQEGEESWT